MARSRKAPRFIPCKVCGTLRAHSKRSSKSKAYCSTACMRARGKLKKGTRVCFSCKQALAFNKFPNKRSPVCRKCNETANLPLEDLKKVAFARWVASKAVTAYGSGDEREDELLLEALESKVIAAIRKTCIYCPTLITETNISFDHIVARGRGGSSHDPNNIQISCLRCNYLKSSLDPNSFLRLLQFLASLPDEDRKLIEARLISGNSRFGN